MVIAAARALLLGGIMCLISACWMSPVPLIDASNASEIDFEGAWQEVESGEPSRITITSNGDGSYTMGDSDELLNTYFVALRGDWYLAQYEGKAEDLAPEATGGAFFLYQPIRVSDEALNLYSPECNEEIASIEGVTSEEGTCGFESYEALMAVAEKYVDAVESGAITGDANVFVRPEDAE